MNKKTHDKSSKDLLLFYYVPYLHFIMQLDSLILWSESTVSKKWKCNESMRR